MARGIVTEQEKVGQGGTLAPSQSRSAQRSGARGETDELTAAKLDFTRVTASEKVVVLEEPSLPEVTPETVLAVEIDSVKAARIPHNEGQGSFVGRDRDQVNMIGHPAFCLIFSGSGAEPEQPGLGLPQKVSLAITLAAENLRSEPS